MRGCPDEHLGRCNVTRRCKGDKRIKVLEGPARVRLGRREKVVVDVLLIRQHTAKHRLLSIGNLCQHVDKFIGLFFIE